MRVRVLSRVEVEAGGAEGAEGADAIISIRASTESVERDLTIALAQATGGESARLLCRAEYGADHRRDRIRQARYRR
jgi:hypothetical protein